MIGLACVAGRLLPPGTALSWLRNALREMWVPIVFFVFFANVPDIDYIPGILIGKLNAYHHYYTHTVAWCVLASTGTWLCWKAFRPRVGLREYFFLLLLSLSHLVADYFTEDTSLPYGIMPWWPLSDVFYTASTPVFMRLEKATYSDIFQWHNVFAVLFEALVTLPLVLGVLLYKRFRPLRKSDAA
jgi:inner membrane protein